MGYTCAIGWDIDVKMKIRRNIKLWCVLVFTLCGKLSSFAQSEEKDLVQFSGLILTSDSIQPIAYAQIFVPGSVKGTISDLNGFFTFAAHKGDSVIFQCLGYKNSAFIIPDTLQGTKYSMIKLMTTDTFYLDETVIRALPSRQLFDYYFVKSDVPDDDLARARKNLDREKLREEREKMGMDGRENQLYYLNQQAQRLYYAGQIPPMNIINPVDWAQLCEDWKRGEFKRDKSAGN